MILGIIADDFTGATDVASMLVRAGMRTVQTIGVPAAGLPLPEADAVVVALKSRTTPAAQAVADSLAALQWLRAGGARQIFFKVCSTFDSTPAGNIGPVAEALMDALGAAQAIACPAFPENGRTVFRGHLFVADQLLSDSGMREHPLTPMTDSNLVRVLQAQSRRRVGLLRHDAIARGAEACRSRLDELARDGIGLVIADAVADDDLRTLAEAQAEAPLLVAGSGLALGLPAAYARRGWLVPDAQAAALGTPPERAAVLSGSCSQATNAQVARWIGAGRPALALDPRALARGEPLAERALAWALAQSSAPLVYATAEPVALKAVQAELGAAHAGELVEQALAQIAQGLVAAGVGRLVVAGGETSGAVVQALGVTRLRIGAAICPGVPWTQAEGSDATLWLALKSGNFGGPDFFAEALA
ncbi:MAG: four-carbon acid sugar kinase family protein [Burkholderiaceae bacterium]|nr:four-carbon acid sugar kinase family protein [Burkholderiaceae bacterium]